jgi:hypothetical protein
VNIEHRREGEALDWQTETDAEGRFRWDGAPKEAVQVSVGKNGYGTVYGVAIDPSGQEKLITLAAGRALRIKGTVVDAETGKAIPSFRIVPAVMGGNKIWLLDYSTTFRNGSYQVAPFLGNIQHLIRIESKGYLPVVSPVFGRDSGEHEFNARLIKGAWLNGVVRGPGGEPLRGAEVILVTGQGVSIGGGLAYQREHHPHELTSTGGVFSICPPLGDFRLVALHEQGYAEASRKQFEPARELRLQPWGRIEGTLRVGGELLAHQLVVASLDDQRSDPAWPTIQNDSRSMTDEKGHFLIERVAPGEARVHWQPDTVTQARPPDR